MTPLRLIPPLLLLALSGCAVGTIDAPSLTTRSVEKDGVPLPDEAREPASTLDPALDAKLKGLLDRANAAHASFSAAEAKATTAVSHAANVAAGSEPWTIAQQELSLLDTARGPLQAVEADVDALHGDPADAAPANRAAIDALAQKVQALDDQENAVVAALGAKLKS